VQGSSPPRSRNLSGSRLDSLRASADPAALESAPYWSLRRREDAPKGGALKDTIPSSVSGPAGQSSRAALIASALRLSYFTIAWNGVIGATALFVSTATRSLALAGFALNALLDSAASAILVWRFRRERRDPHAADRLERRAQALIALAMLVIALYVGFEAVRALMNASHADESLLGVVLAVVSLLVLPWLGRRKLRVASAVSSRALRGDAVLTLAAAALAAITLVALLAAGAFGWWWADPAAALVISGFLTVEGARVAIHRRFG
jgi:divalent metal cation (Fe/Co/Zn/Cd) transporter